jgi:hypothetical protein
VNPPGPRRSPALKSPTATTGGIRPVTGPGRSRTRAAVAWLTVTTTGTPLARSVCACGRDRTARGREPVLALITEHADHRAACPLRTPHADQEETAA